MYYLKETESWKYEDENGCKASQELNNFADVGNEDGADERRREPRSRDENASLQTRRFGDAVSRREKLLRLSAYDVTQIVDDAEKVDFIKQKGNSNCQ